MERLNIKEMISKIKNYIVIAFILFVVGYLTYLTATFSFVRTKYINNLERLVKSDSLTIIDLSKKVTINDSLINALSNDNLVKTNNVLGLQKIIFELNQKNTILAERLDKIEKNGNVRFFVKSFWSNKYTEVYENPNKK
jgi:hypothetical protein